MRLLDRHLIRAAVGPFLFGLFTITFLLMIDVLFDYVDMFVSKGVAFSVATRVLILSLGFTLALSVPMSVLVAVLMSVGQLAGDNEITAMKASGVSLWAVLRPLALGAAIIGVGLTAFNHYVYPESNHTLVNLLYDIKRSRPMLEIREQMFTDLKDDMTIYVASKDDRTGRITDVSIVEKEQGDELSPRVTTADWGVIVTDPATDALILELHDGEIHELPDPDQPQKYQVIRFGRHVIRLENMQQELQDSQRESRGDREMNLTDLRRAARDQRDKRHEVESQIANLNADVVQWQFRQLLPDERAQLAGHDAANPAERRTRLGATRRKLEHAVSQSRAQATIVDSIDRKTNKFLVEYHKKLAIPFACLVFALVGVPMAVSTSRSGRGVSISLAMLVYLVYYLCLVGGEKLSDRGMLDPALAMWSGNLLLLGGGIPLFSRAVRETSYLQLPWPPRRRAAGTSA
ncbi:MAG TPA: LptF/LptG family permease [Candidatus Krumholzibacteria bacterium]|nr:LptF/LptG family permease [Candidatus Krumholzibacteria bacterium]HPD71303.1 LptF/LptG family permease [Candidatus Krumholzibacteria bacterium]HRY38997.1 LptF/LptG family permease [Candidatus Krumholzibacteria bacterium]